MKIVLATGIYPPDIGGPATYAYHLAKELSNLGHAVSVITYVEDARYRKQDANEATSYKLQATSSSDPWNIIKVSKSGGPLLRWWRYSRALKKHGHDADIIYAFSSVSCGVPLKMVRLCKPKTVLRLGGDFLWERATDGGMNKSLSEFYTNSNWQLTIGSWLLNHFNHIVFSTDFQKKIYEGANIDIPQHSIIENARPTNEQTSQSPIAPSNCNKLLWIGRMVNFKNLPSLLKSLTLLPNHTLTLVGDGPVKKKIESLATTLGLSERVTFLPVAHGEEKAKLFAEHDLFVLPSLTDISPNIALEAAANGIPVLLTEENGLSKELQTGMTTATLRTPKQIADEISKYSYELPTNFSQHERTWKQLAKEHISLFNSLVT